jgi:hypothetical protein
MHEGDSRIEGGVSLIRRRSRVGCSRTQLKLWQDANNIHNQFAPVVHVRTTMMQSRMMRRGSKGASEPLFWTPNLTASRHRLWRNEEHSTKFGLIVAP